MRNTIACAALFSLAALPAAAEIYRCSAPNKAVSYQEQPCEAAALEDKVALPTQFPDHLAARNRLDSREAAADARILERLKIESAERIARDERAAREAALAAERERAQATEAWYPVYVGMPQPRVRPVLGRQHPGPRIRPIH